MKYFRSILTFVLLFTMQEIVKAQNKEIEIENEKKKINDFFFNNLPWKATKDSTMMIGFSFKVNLQKNKKKEINQISIIASDSIAYKLFPKYELLKKIDYKLFLKDRKEGIFIIPILIELVGSQPDEYYTKEKLLDFWGYSIFYRSMFKGVQSMLHIDQSWENNPTENYTYLKPVIIWMDKRVGH